VPAQKQKSQERKNFTNAVSTHSRKALIEDSAVNFAGKRAIAGKVES
jgi:hypothetical protein